MKTIRIIHAVFVLMVLAMLMACTQDNADSIGGGETQAGKTTIHMSLSISAPSASRAATLSWTDGTDAENMKTWVVAFVKDGKVVAFAENQNVADGKRIKDDVTITGLTNGETYQVYSFANLSASELGISKDATVDFDTKTWKMAGNGYDVSTHGIPMSNKQEVTIDANGNPNISELWVVRMLAKITLQFKNPSSTALEINSITINDITQNPAADDADGNIMLLPKHSNADKDEVVCLPNLSTHAVSQSYTYTLPAVKTIAANTTDYTDENEVSFYVNESKAEKTSDYYIINLNTSAGVKRYALFQDWTSIARNDHHILPISLDDYKVQFNIQAYSAIGMYPSVTDNGTTLSYTCYYPEEEFHISPKVIKLSDNTELIGIDKSQIKWELITEKGMADEAAAQANAKKVFLSLPKWDATAGLLEGIFQGDAAEKHSALYKVTIPVSSEKSLIYKVQFTNDLILFAARKYYTRKLYRYE